MAQFTERARRALAEADDQARHLRYTQTDVEHLLLALLDDEESVAAKALAALGVSTVEVRSALGRELAAGHASGGAATGLAPRATRAVEAAVVEAKQLGLDQVGTEHLLLGLLCDAESAPARVLAALGVTPERARDVVGRVLSRPAPGEVGLKRYNVVLPEELFRDLQELADRRHTSVVELMRRFLRLGLLVTRVSETPGSAVIIREGDTERQILLL
ncbi:MAG TPA: Clp protease N-terminal domain-containing protein [Chloroflexota bacterium]|nr:Clp protease N-terminal domain-containing protein [Chloroflexota bacterium]